MYYKVTPREYADFLLETCSEYHDNVGMYQKYKGVIVSVEDRGSDVLPFDYFGRIVEEVVFLETPVESSEKAEAIKVEKKRGRPKKGV